MSPHAQLTFDEIVPDREIPLHQVTFVVVDLETTGGSSANDAVTEIGAVKVRGGEVVGEFATLVDPGREIPPAVVSITGITQAMVHDAPSFESVLPSFLEFAEGAVLVAHNAPFDVGFLRSQCERQGLRWPKPDVVCTVKLARRVLTRDETPNYKLGTLAGVLRARTSPVHRALDDARATVDVLHALLERVGPLGVRTLEDLLGHLPDVSPLQRQKRGLADQLPNASGVYLFRGPNDEVLYVGTATDLRRRVRQYFTAGEKRSRMKEMVGLADRVDHVVCSHPLEAEVRELRLLAAHAPRYNRRSKFPQRAWWVALTDEPFPRLSIVRTPKPSALGPFSSRRAATEAVDALQEATSIRRCTERIPAENQRGRPCALHELGRCAAPCAGLQSVEAYAPEVVSIQDVVTGRGTEVLERLRAELDRLSAAERFEDAAVHRDRLAALVRSLDRGQRLSALAGVPELVGPPPDGRGGRIGGRGGGAVRRRRGRDR
ncbi:DEDD exonuclease domain-containing protein, partial [Saccharopolyspora taberi]